MIPRAFDMIVVAGNARLASWRRYVDRRRPLVLPAEAAFGAIGLTKCLQRRGRHLKNRASVGARRVRAREVGRRGAASLCTGTSAKWLSWAILGRALISEIARGRYMSCVDARQSPLTATGRQAAVKAVSSRSLPDSSGLLVGSPINEGRLFSMSGARYWERIDGAAPHPTYVSMALPTFPYKDLWGGSQIEKKPVLPINSFCCPPLLRRS
mgnify:FL=1